MGQFLFPDWLTAFYNSTWFLLNDVKLWLLVIQDNLSYRE